MLVRRRPLPGATLVGSTVYYAGTKRSQGRRREEREQNEIRPN